MADPTADMGIRQLGEEKVTLLENGSLQYRHPRSDELCTVSSEYWATDWDKTVVGAYNKLNEKISDIQNQLHTLETAKQELIQSSPKLQRIAKQLKLF
ncbi:MAG: hypothetical protein JXX29_02675 [Deltaproteobacteria bacterium]|nr:hypothetical protein [Deltaproteobacteria bacterium]MBN2670546.1 hypothetical protein [Deltaproteobacteria bacterium]